jgi:hypothetical protein
MTTTKGPHTMTTEIETTRRKFCDVTITRAAELMIENGADVPMILDRLLTYATAQACSIDGAFNTAKMFRHIADQIDAGTFAHLEPASKGKGH